jgi:hypothetical protein
MLIKEDAEQKKLRISKALAIWGNIFHSFKKKPPSSDDKKPP